MRLMLTFATLTHLCVSRTRVHHSGINFRAFISSTRVCKCVIEIMSANRLENSFTSLLYIYQVCALIGSFFVIKLFLISIMCGIACGVVSNICAVSNLALLIIVFLGTNSIATGIGWQDEDSCAIRFCNFQLKIFLWLYSVISEKTRCYSFQFIRLFSWYFLCSSCSS